MSLVLRNEEFKDLFFAGDSRYMRGVENVLNGKLITGIF